jgi:plastocyanin
MTTHRVSIKKAGYTPDPCTVRRGDTVRWENNDARPHSAKSDGAGKTFDTGEIDKGKHANVVINHAPGRIPYTDGYGDHHKGVIIVI